MATMTADLTPLIESINLLRSEIAFFAGFIIAVLVASLFFVKMGGIR
ncbi:MAG: hypothetical protein LBT22_08430 [Peptococcaceae bacterium]|jgi:hypothetical protein|nr:hypothetical protein [Peptococcaceae bacterium]